MAVWRDSGLFSPAEKAALALAEAMTELPADVSDELFADLREQFTEEQIVELAATIGLENYRARMNRVFQVESAGRYKPPD